MNTDKHRWAFVLFLLCLPAALVAQTQFSSDIVAASNSLRSALLSEDGDVSLRASQRLETAIFAQIKATPPVSYESTKEYRTAKPTPPLTSLAGLEPILTKIDTSVVEGKLILARDYSLALATAIGETIQARKPTTQAILHDSEQNAIGVTGFKRYLLLPKLAKTAYEAGDLVKADAYSSELLADTEKYGMTGNQGEAIFYGNLVKGRIELDHGNLPGAVVYLLSAGRTTGSPSLNSFGPNMSLARDLLLRGQPAPVLTYLDLCAAFWKDDHGALKLWKAQVESGKFPDFGANLNY
jgi:hypothetical protein